jgi:hypothetical protein
MYTNEDMSSRHLVQLSGLFITHGQTPRLNMAMITIVAVIACRLVLIVPELAHQRHKRAR